MRFIKGRVILLKVKHAMLGWFFLAAGVFLLIAFVAPIAMMFTGGVPQAGDTGNFFFLWVLAVPTALIVSVVLGVITLPIAILACAKDKPTADDDIECGHELTSDEIDKPVDSKTPTNGQNCKNANNLA